MRISVVPAKRKEQAFSRPVETWTFVLYTGPRCKGMKWQGEYRDPVYAQKAAEKVMDRIKSGRGNHKED